MEHKLAHLESPSKETMSAFNVEFCRGGMTQLTGSSQYIYKAKDEDEDEDNLSDLVMINAIDQKDLVTRFLVNYMIPLFRVSRSREF